MIEVKDKKDCSGCGACVFSCNRRAVYMEPDEHGFLYPNVDYSHCIYCGYCLYICPVTGWNMKRPPLISEPYNLGSGAAYTLLTRAVLERGGNVFGPTRDSNKVVKHKFMRDMDLLPIIERHNDTQSDMGDTYLDVRLLLIHQEEVLFVGDACQLSGLRNFLKKDYKTLVMANIECHGVYNAEGDTLRPSCQNCHFPEDDLVADLTIRPDSPVALIRTERGRQFLEGLK